MIIIEIQAQNNGAHRNQTSNGVVPEGWAIKPDGMECENFPFGDITVNAETPPVVTKWTPLPMPEVEPVKEAPTQLDIIEAQVTYTAMMTDTLLGG